jgi:hypothetical protein
MGAYTLHGEVGGGWALEFPSFLGPVKWERADRRVPFGSGMCIPDHGSDFVPSRIPDPNCLHPGSASKNLSILTPKKIKKMVSKL